MKKINKNTIIEFIKFSMVGVVNTVLSYIIYAVLTKLGVWYIVSSIIGFIITVFVSFELNHHFVFKDSDGSLKALLKVYTSYLSTTILSTILLYVWVDVFGISEYIAPFINLVITVPLNFLLNKFWGFSGGKNAKKNKK